MTSAEDTPAPAFSPAAAALRDMIATEDKRADVSPVFATRAQTLREALAHVTAAEAAQDADSSARHAVGHWLRLHSDCDAPLSWSELREECARLVSDPVESEPDVVVTDFGNPHASDEPDPFAT